MKNYLRVIFKPLRLAKSICSDPNKFRYWLHKKIGAEFIPKVPNFPPMIFLETTTRCNLKCYTCPREKLIKEGHFEIGDMDLNFYKQCIDEIANYPGVVLRPFNDGEPLLHPQIIEMIKYAKKKKVYVWMNTNGLLLEETKARAFIEAGLDVLEVSIDAVNEETYKHTRPGGDYNRVVENVRRYVELKKINKSSVKIVVSFVETTGNFADVAKFKKLWEGYVDRVFIRPFHQIDRCLNDMKARDYKFKRRYPCPQLWRRFIVNHDGKVKFCVQDCRNQGIIGDRKKQTIKEIWQNRPYKEIRQLHIQGNFSEILPCRDCNDYFQWTWFGQHNEN